MVSNGRTWARTSIKTSINSSTVVNALLQTFLIETFRITPFLFDAQTAEKFQMKVLAGPQRMIEPQLLGTRVAWVGNDEIYPGQVIILASNVAGRSWNL